MNQRFALFLLLSGALFLANVAYLAMNQQNRPQAEQADAQRPRQQQAKQPPAELEIAPFFDPRQELTEAPERWLTLGSADPSTGYRLLLTFTSRGASLYRAESNLPRYLDLEARQNEKGYLGELALRVAPGGNGVEVRVVGPGTAAQQAGLQVGDVITGITGPDQQLVPIKTPAEYSRALAKFEVKDQITLHVQRPQEGGTTELTLKATLVPVQLSILDPDQPYAAYNPHSMLLTLQRFDDQTIPAVVADLSPIGLEATTSDEAGVLVANVMPNSPASRAGLRPGDLITAVDNTEIETVTDLVQKLHETPSAMRVPLTYRRNDLVTLTTLEMPAEIAAGPAGPAIELRDANWTVHHVTESTVEFRRELIGRGVTAVKRYTLGKVADRNEAPAYTVNLEFEFINQSDRPHTVAYQLDGPRGLPIEGWWYSNKIGRQWGAVGVRDVAFYVQDNSPQMVSAYSLAQGNPTPIQPAEPLWYVGVDGHYFASALLPTSQSALLPATMLPLRVGPVPANSKEHKLVNTSFRLIGKPVELPPGQQLGDEWRPGPTAQSLRLFIGPKAPALLAQEGDNLSELVYYGWFGWVARPMLAILRIFYGIVGNYGIAIILLTVLVRAAMFPLSRKQALSAQKMQELQPELRRINEKYKKNYEARTKATQELFRKHNYNPFGGCLLLFIQLPIFVGLYRGLMVNVELRQAPLIPGISWCSNLAAPDMLFRWDGFMPAFIASETGWLGPYFNILPIITISLFIVHQKLFMPPPADEQQAMQQSMMKYMMIVFGLLFFCVPSGLCIYFIASSLWGIAERKLLPKTQHATAAMPAATERAAKGGNPNGSPPGGSRKTQRGGK